MKRILAHITLDGGSLLSSKNAHKIVARSTKPTDRYGNTLDKNGKSPIGHLQNEPPYFRRWAVKKEKEGFIFREVNSNSGICGHAPTVRALVIKALCGISAAPGSAHIVVEVAE